MDKQEQKKQRLLKELQKGFDDIKAGRITTKSIDEIFEKVLAKRKAKGIIEKP